ncbi:hypothetical protein POTOM_018336 [Populus tomentosa]|uniref:Glucose-6-phosphate dehydrogenase C-terminal domain-containing protein n=1 Tax=Populus tomentosa TaxID=118781 RepID=A0A8X7ZYZ2_POPTO|nr:hypothetical protein POTOM_018336 [Populus tomentosa]
MFRRYLSLHKIICSKNHDSHSLAFPKIKCFEDRRTWPLTGTNDIFSVIRVHFHNVPENLYCERVKVNIELATNELILSDAPNEAILVKINNKIPGLGLQLDAPELNLLYKDNEANSAPTLFYNAEVPDSSEHLLLDFIDGDNHLFMRSDELAAAWNILTPTLQEMDKKTYDTRTL